MTVQFIEMTEAGTLTISDEDTDVHYVLYGDSVTEYTIAFDAANSFSTRRLYRFSNDGALAVINVANSTGSISDVLLPGNVMQVTLTSLATVAGNWKMRQHICGAGSYEA